MTKKSNDSPALAPHDVFKKLVNEAQGFLSMADSSVHGVTNIRVLQQRIDDARAALAEPAAPLPCNCDCLPHLDFCNLYVEEENMKDFTEPEYTRLKAQKEQILAEQRAKQVCTHVFYVVEKFERGLSVGYWDGTGWYQNIDEAVQFRREKDAINATTGKWPSKEVKITSHSYMAAAPSSVQAQDRTDKDYAIEHGGYLADAAEAYLDERNRYDIAVAGYADEDSEVANVDSLTDHHQALRSRIYEFRKRAVRASSPSSATEQEDSNG